MLAGAVKIPPGGGFRSSRKAPSPYLFVEVSGLVTGLSGEGLPEPLILQNSLLASPAKGVQAHQAGVRLFPGWIFGVRPPEHLDAPLVFFALFVERSQIQEQRVIQAAQLPPPVLRPLLVAVFRKQLPGVLLDRRFVSGGRPFATGGYRR